MFCPSCFSREQRVVDSRPDFNLNQVRRKRVCVQCQFRFSTTEVVETGMPRIIKRSGALADFDAGKIRTGIMKAIEKRPMSVGQLDQVVARVLHRIGQMQLKHLHAKEVGYIIIDELKGVDLVAMIRFSSVYHSFKDIESFQMFIDEMLSSDLEKQ